MGSVVSILTMITAKFLYLKGHYWKKKGLGYIDKKYIRKNIDWIEKIKMFVPKAIGSGDSKKDFHAVAKPTW